MDARLLAVVCVQFSDQTLEREFLLQDFRATAIFVPLFAFVVNALVFVLLLAVPAARPGGAFIFPTFLAIGLGRVLVQFMADEEHALQVYGWMWVASTVTMFSGWVDAQRRYELVTGLGLGFLSAAVLLLILVSLYLRLLIGAFVPRILTLLCYIAGWACTWPRISVLGSPGEPLALCGALLLGHALSHAMERDKRAAFLRGKGLELGNGVEADESRKPRAAARSPRNQHEAEKARGPSPQRPTNE